jgi:hypothetical protein
VLGVIVGARQERWFGAVVALAVGAGLLAALMKCTFPLVKLTELVLKESPIDASVDLANQVRYAQENDGSPCPAAPAHTVASASTPAVISRAQPQDSDTPAPP